jgi:hypothetical protein
MFRSSLAGNIVLGVISWPVVVQAVEPLRHDVFARPAISALSPATLADVELRDASSAAWSPRLTAIMVAGKASLVTVDGKILKVGDDIDGFRLLRVAEGVATFIKDGQPVVVNMAPAGFTPSKQRDGQ